MFSGIAGDSTQQVVLAYKCIFDGRIQHYYEGALAAS